MPPSADQARRLLCELGDHVRDPGGRLRATSTWRRWPGRRWPTRSTPSTAWRTTPSSGWFEEHWPDVRVVSEGLDEPVVVGEDRGVDRDRRHHRRDARADVRQAARLVPGRGGARRRARLADIVAAAMTELPTAKQGAVDQLSGVPGRRSGGRATRPAPAGRASRWRCDRRRRPTSSTASAGWPSSSSREAGPGLARGRAVPAARLPPRLRRRVPLDRWPAPRAHHRPGSVRRRPAPAGRSTTDGLACHPYDVCTAMLLAEAGGVVTDPWGRPLDAPLDNIVAGGVGRLCERSAGRTHRPGAG